MRTFELIVSDLYRYEGKISIGKFIKNVFFNPGFKYSFLIRLAKKFNENIWLRYSIYILIWPLINRYTYRYGIEISHKTVIGYGFYIGHFSGIIVSQGAKIGNNCNISQGVTIGYSSRGVKKGFPTIGDNVYIGPGAKIFGNIIIGDNVAIGANCVVNSDAPNNSVIIGIPGKVISYKGSEGYINNCYSLKKKHEII